jgi:hypothetical protein
MSDFDAYKERGLKGEESSIVMGRKKLELAKNKS